MQSSSSSSCIKNNETVDSNSRCCSNYSISTAVSNPFTHRISILSVCTNSPNSLSTPSK